MNPLLPVMDRIVYLAGGRAASGTTDEVVRTETLSDLYGHPRRRHPRPMGGSCVVAGRAGGEVLTGSPVSLTELC